MNRRKPKSSVESSKPCAKTSMGRERTPERRRSEPPIAHPAPTNQFPCIYFFVLVTRFSFAMIGLKRFLLLQCFERPKTSVCLWTHLQRSLVSMVSIHKFLQHGSNMEGLDGSGIPWCPMVSAGPHKGN